MSKIEWTDKTWNPIRAKNKVTGGIGHFCEKVSAGCKLCYAEQWQPRFKNPIHFGPQDFDKVEIFLDEKILMQPLHWREPKKIFAFDMTDLFGHWVPVDWLHKIHAVMALSFQHTYQVLTKRIDRAHKYYTEEYSVSNIVQASKFIHDYNPEHFKVLKQRHFNSYEAGRDGSWPLKNVWLGTSDEGDQHERLDILRKTPAAIRYISAEPLLFNPGKINLDGIHWVICGGQSGHHAQPMHPDWARSLRDQCQAAGVPFFFKQWGEWGPNDNTHPGKYLDSKTLMMKAGKKYNGRLLDGREWNEFPKVKEVENA